MAQEEMIKLLHVKNDYVFIKDKEINIIESPTFNQHDLYYLANRYYGYFDYRKIRDDFINFNINFFNAIYFMLAPILTIPIYQQTRYFDLSSKKGDKGYSCYAMESKINLSLDKDIYVHPDSKTENIFKVNRIVLKNNVETDEVIAYGYRTSFRTVVVTVVDFEAGTVLVPVIVIDYISVSKKTNIENRILDISKDNANKQKMNFAIASAIVAASMPSDSVPNKEELLKNNPESNRKKRTKK